MYLIIDFGITKLANKVKKQAWEKDLFTKTGGSRLRRKYSQMLEGSILGKNKTGILVRRGRNRLDIRNEVSLPQVTRKPRSGERSDRSTVKYEMIPDNKNFTDIRKVEDKALSKSGYMGYKNTPNSYFEESVPMVESGKKTKIKPRVYV